MEVYRDTAEHLQQECSKGVAAGTSLIEKCAELDDRMEGVKAIGAQLRDIESALTSLEGAMEGVEADSSRTPPEA